MDNIENFIIELIREYRSIHDKNPEYLVLNNEAFKSIFEHPHYCINKEGNTDYAVKFYDVRLICIVTDKVNDIRLC